MNVCYIGADAIRDIHCGALSADPGLQEVVFKLGDQQWIISYAISRRTDQPKGWKVTLPDGRELIVRIGDVVATNGVVIPLSRPVLVRLIEAAVRVAGFYDVQIQRTPILGEPGSQVFGTFLEVLTEEKENVFDLRAVRLDPDVGERVDDMMKLLDWLHGQLHIPPLPRSALGSLG